MPETAASPAQEVPGQTPPLDDVMLAMDVVDTLRYADSLVQRELSSDERDRQLKERLRQIYASQGLEVTDSILDEGVAALKENRFLYDPPKSGSGRWLAMLWIRRARWGKALLFALGFVLLATGGYYFGIELPRERRAAEQAQALAVELPQRLAGEVARIKAVAENPEVAAEAERLAREGLAAAQAGDRAAAQDLAAKLAALRGRLEQVYSLRVVSRPDQPSGVFRIPDANPNARNYYLIVEAIGPDGKALPVPVLNEETGKTQTVTIWGLRVPQAVYDRIRADKLDDGIIQNAVIGQKRRGALDPDYQVPLAGGAILEW